MKHFAIVGVSVIISTFLVNLLLQSIGLLPQQASTQAVIIDRLFNAHFLLISFLFSLIAVFMVYSLVVFRRKPGDENVGRHIKSANGLEIVWTILPLSAVLYFSFLGSQSLADIRRVDPQAMEVKVIGGQWYWIFEYPEYGITSKSLNLPVDRQVLLKMTSRDVIHSFWVPEFRVKQDLLPGENFVKELRFTPSELGEFKVRCAELCGASHAYMESPVVVMKQADFEAWLASESKASSATPAERGQKWASAYGCVACHSVDGKRLVGPTWKGLYGKQEQLADGTTVQVDDAYLRAAILDPNSQVVKGYPPNVMASSYGQTVTPEKIDDIIAFIQSLK